MCEALFCFSDMLPLIFDLKQHIMNLTLPPGWAGSYTCPALRPYKFGPMRIPECNHNVTGGGCKAVVSCEAETSTKSLVMCSKSALTGLVSS